MATMTAAQIERVRAFSGDKGAKPEVSDDLMQTFFDDEEVAGDLNKTVVYVLRVRVINAASLVNETNEAQVQKSLSQKFDQLKEMLKDWEARTGMDGSEISIGTLDLGIDTDPCDPPLPPRGWGWRGY